jgi:3-oxoacyl-[acyl-carrier-protein] synthase II
MKLFEAIEICDMSAISGLGADLDESYSRWTALCSGVKTDCPEFKKLGLHSAGWIEKRNWAKGRKYGVASQLAVEVVKDLMNKYKGNKKRVGLFVGSSRGNLMEYMDDVVYDRRRFKQMKASNTMHSEIAGAIAAEYELNGMWQLVSGGCAAGLDALGMAAIYLEAGMCDEALVVAVDLPLNQLAVDAFTASGLISAKNQLNPYDITTDGLILGEGACALWLKKSKGREEGKTLLKGYHSVADGQDVLMSHGVGLKRLLKEMGQKWDFICPHATGTQSHRQAEMELFAIQDWCSAKLLPMKPLTGHGLGASGLLELILVIDAIRKGKVPALPQTLTEVSELYPIIKESQKVDGRVRLCKFASSMGGHHSGVDVEIDVKL